MVHDSVFQTAWNYSKISLGLVNENKLYVIVSGIYHVMENQLINSAKEETI